GHHCRDCQHRAGSDSRIRSDARHHRRQSKKKKAESRSGPKVREISNPGTEAIHRFEIPDETGSRIYRFGGFVTWGTPDDDAWSMVSERLYAARGSVALSLVG